MISDIIIQFGLRSILSLVGIIMIVLGVWYVDRTWDEKGSAAYARAKAKKKSNVVIPKKDLDDAFAFPIIFIVGWIIFASSYLFSTNGSAILNINPYNIGAIAFSLIIAIVASIPMGNAVRYRNKNKKMKLSMMFALSWVGLTITSGFSTNLGFFSFILGAIGAVCIILSMKILWKYRKMGDSWEQDGRPNPNPIVYNLGGPLFIIGWFFFWVSMASTTGTNIIGGLPIHFNLRTALAFFAGCGMVPIVMIVDYAHDQGGKYVGFGTDGKYFGRFMESPIPFIAMWILFGVSSFITINNSFVTDARRWILLANCILQAIVIGLFIQPSLYKGNMDLKTKLSRIFAVLFLAIAINIGFYNKLALYLALTGAVCVMAGQMTVFKDRKRGDYWMINKVVNPNPIVYSLGLPLFMTGWILLSLAMSLPM